VTLRSPTTLSARARTARSSRIRELLRLADRPDVLSLAGGLPAPELLPVERVREAIDRVLTRRTIQYAPTEGLAELREITRADLVTTGSQQSIDLVARALLDPGDVVVLASPAYLGAVQAFEAAGASLHGVASDDDGLDVDALAHDIGAGVVPKLVYVVPNFHNPSGAVLSAARRTHLAQLAQHHGFVVVSDDPYGALRFDGTAALGDIVGERVVQLHSASKVLAPGLRIGWMHGPREIVDACARLKQAVDLHTSALDQAVVAELLSDRAWFDEHVATICATYERRATALADALDVPRARGGMFTWVRWPGVDTDRLADEALRRGVAFVPGVAFSLDGHAHHDEMRLCHATLDEAALRQAAKRLRALR
jgi:2-aminoadipate transaminase